MKKKETKKQRKLKVYSKYSTDFYRKVKILPEIRLKGVWLKKLGYECGDEIMIYSIESAIIIRNSKKIIHTIIL